jgi:hypothetical protein
MTNEEIKELIESKKFKRNHIPETEKVIFSISGKTIGCSQSFVCFQGMPKNGKSLFITSAIASAFTTWDIFEMKINFQNNRKRLCYVDTESSDFDFYKTLERIRRQTLLDQLPHNFDALCVREETPEDIKKLLEFYLEFNPDCSILVLDGILDLIQDFNNVAESFHLVQWLKKITKKHDLLILCVLHLGKKDNLSIGHIGSFLDRKSQSVLRVEKNKEKKTIELSSTFLRSSDDFNPISIQFQGSVWYQVDSTPVNKSNDVFGINKTILLSQVLLEPKGYNALASDLCERTGKGLTSIKKLLKDWIADGTIVKHNDQYKTKK